MKKYLWRSIFIMLLSGVFVVILCQQFYQKRVLHKKQAIKNKTYDPKYVEPDRQESSDHYMCVHMPRTGSYNPEKERKKQNNQQRKVSLADCLDYVVVSGGTIALLARDLGVKIGKSPVGSCLLTSLFVLLQKDQNTKRATDNLSEVQVKLPYSNDIPKHADSEPAIQSSAESNEIFLNKKPKKEQDTRKSDIKNYCYGGGTEPHEVQVVQLPVMRQNIDGICGYHALLNGRLIAQLLADNPVLDPVQAVYNNPLFFNKTIVKNFMRAYAPVVQDARNGRLNLDEKSDIYYKGHSTHLTICYGNQGAAGVDALNTMEIKHMAEREKQSGSIRDPIDVMVLFKNPGDFQDREQEDLQRFLDGEVLQKFKAGMTHNANYRHIFVVGVLVEDDGQHAVTVVVEKRRLEQGSKVWYFLADSGGFKPIDNFYVQKFIETLERN